MNKHLSHAHGSHSCPGCLWSRKVKESGVADSILSMTEAIRLKIEFSGTGTKPYKLQAHEEAMKIVESTLTDEERAQIF